MSTGRLVVVNETVKTCGLDAVPEPRPDQHWKRRLGLGLLSLCERMPAARSWLGKAGMRTQPAWFADRVVEVPLPNRRGLKLASFGHNYLSFQLFWRGLNYYEPITRMLSQELLEPGDTFVDCGAQVGFYSLVLSLMKPGISVVAFEPNPRNFQLLVANVIANHLGNVACQPIALSDAVGSARLYLASSDMSASLLPDFEQETHTAVEVPTTTIDAYLETHRPKGHLVLKVDVEGAEEKFFAGAIRTISTYRPDIICEVATPISQEAVAFVKDFGYGFYRIADEGLVPSDTLTPNVKGDMLFLNYLLSPLAPAELAQLFDRIRPR